MKNVLIISKVGASMEKSYKDYVCDYIVKQDVGKPIYVEVISEQMACDYGMTKQKAAGAVSVACKRIMDGGLLPELRNFQKGIFYKTAAVQDGETEIDMEQLIADKYLTGDNGYETGRFLLYKLGIVDKIPLERVFTTNKAKDCARVDKKLGITIRPPKVKITAENKQYLKVLDVLDILEDEPVEIDNPFEVIGEYIKSMKLDYCILLAFANHYYNRQTILRLAQVAEKSCVYTED